LEYSETGKYAKGRKGRQARRQARGKLTHTILSLDKEEKL